MDQAQTTGILLLAKQGDAGAMNALIARVGPRLLQLIRLRLTPFLRQHLEAEDVLQEVLLKAFQHFPDFEKESSRSFFAWLAIIAGNTIRDLSSFLKTQRRDVRKNRVASGNIEVEKHCRSAISELIIDDEVQGLENALAQLKTEYREVILLRHFEERTFKEIAEITDGTPDGCRMLLGRAMAALTLLMDTKKGKKA